MADAGTVSKRDSKQAHLLRRYAVAAASSLLVLLFMFALYLEGFLEETGFLYTTAAILFFITFYYVVFRSGLNFKANDPSLTVAQVLSAIGTLTLAMYFTESSARGVIMPIVLMAFVFGVFRLETRRLVHIALAAIIGYALMVALLVRFRPQAVTLELEVLRVAIFGLVLLWFAVMGGYISRLRKNLSDSKAALGELATRDALTDVHNRRHLMSVLEQEKSRSDRSGNPFCVGLLDLDFFKKINDEFGHQAGDEVLKAFARCGTEAVRPMDYFGRYGGEEFEMLLSQTRLEGARAVAERIRSAAARLEFPQADRRIRLTVSIGLAQYRPGESIEETEQRADEALYRAKTAGRNRVEIEAAGQVTSLGAAGVNAG